MAKKKRRPIPAIRRYRRAALRELSLIVVLSVLAAVIIARKMDSEPIFEIREERLMTPPVHIITTEPEPTPEVTQLVWVKYPVPLENDLQRWIGALCKGTDIPTPIVMAMIAVETGGTFDAGLVGDNGNSFGLMQIYKSHHEERMERLGVTDLTDPYQNVTVGIDLLDELSTSYDAPIEWVLMAYNGGPQYADRLLESGEVSEYAQKVITLSECYLESAMVMQD